MNWKAVCLLVLILVFVRVSGVAAQCNSTQVDINSASLDEMMSIVHLGGSGKVAQRVIDARPFSSLQELSRVSGFGGTGKNLQDIINQGLACVADNESKQAQTQNNSSVSQSENNSGSATSTSETVAAQTENQNNLLSTSTPTHSETNSDPQSSGNSQIHKTPITPQVINLNAQNPGNASSTKTDYSIRANPAIYGLVAFSIVLGLLFAARKFRTKRYKSEFD